jgi:hypothetical protein
LHHSFVGEAELEVGLGRVDAEPKRLGQRQNLLQAAEPGTESSYLDYPFSRKFMFQLYVVDSGVYSKDLVPLQPSEGESGLEGVLLPVYNLN